jgi:hypothetical protein
MLALWKNMNEQVKDAGQRGGADPVSRVVSALENPRWDFRTLAGISKETGLSESEVRDILESNPGIVRKSHAADKSGRPLFASASRPVRWKERLAAWQSALK